MGENNRKKIHANDNRGGGKWKWMVPDPWGVLPKETVSCQLLEMLTTGLDLLKRVVVSLLFVTD